MFKLFKDLKRRDFFFIVIILGLIVMQVWLDLRLPDYMSEITKLIQTDGSSVKDNA